MCLILIAWKSDGRFPLVVAANRDELHARLAAPARWWSDHPQILGGRDLEANGTWMAVTRDGRFGAVTNYRDPFAPGPGNRSRGALVVDFLASQMTAAEYVQEVNQRREEYGGFGLLVADRNMLCYATNRGELRVDVPAGVHGLSNHLLDTPWPKVERGRNELRSIIGAASAPEALVDAALDMLGDRSVAPDHELPDTGVGLDRERRLSALFIVDPVYGTRASTVFAIEENGSARYAERTFDASGGMTGETKIEFAVESAR